MTKVLLLSASYGDGHRQVARALRTAFERRNVTVHEVDCFQQTNQWFADASQWIYEGLTRSIPMVYGVVHKITANLPPNSIVWRLSTLFSRRAMMQAILQIQPDIVLQLFPDHAATLLQSLPRKPYLGVVITDFSVHSRWFHAGVDTYFVPHAGLIQSMRRFTSAPAKFVNVGIPIREHFQTKQMAAQPSPVSSSYVVIATGGRGVFPNLERVITCLRKGFPKHEVYVLCGRNAGMLRDVEAISDSKPTVHGVPFVEDVAPWYCGAALAVVKAGGVTVSECLACACPMVFYKPQPGQEMDNARYLETIGAGVVARNYRALMRMLEDENFQGRLETMQKIAERMGRPCAAEDIVEKVLQNAGVAHDERVVGVTGGVKAGSTDDA